MRHRPNISDGNVDARTDYERRYQPLELAGPFPGQQSQDVYAAFLEKLEEAGLYLTPAEQHLAWTMYRAAWADSYLHQLQVAVERQRKAS